MRTIATALAAAVIATGAATDAQASMVENFTSSSGFIGLGAFNGSVEWDYAGTGRRGMLYVTVENDSSSENGGYLTAFGFNVVDGLRLRYHRQASDEVSPLWRRFRNGDADPFGTLDFGMALRGRFRWNGNSDEGLAVGESRMFAFHVRGRQSLLQELGPSSFLDESNGEAFVARFYGFDSGGTSDIVKAALPAPGALPLLALGLGAGRRRRTR